jgi:hypothetical protein
MLRKAFNINSTTHHSNMTAEELTLAMGTLDDDKISKLIFVLLVVLTIIIGYYTITIKMKDTKAFMNVCKRNKTDILPVVNKKKAKESPFIGPYHTTITPNIPKLENSTQVFRFRSPIKQEISSETRITIVTTVENNNSRN